MEILKAGGGGSHIQDETCGGFSVAAPCFNKLYDLGETLRFPVLKPRSSPRLGAMCRHINSFLLPSTTNLVPPASLCILRQYSIRSRRRPLHRYCAMSSIACIEAGCRPARSLTLRTFAASLPTSGQSPDAEMVSIIERSWDSLCRCLCMYKRMAIALPQIFSTAQDLCIFDCFPVYSRCSS